MLILTNFFNNKFLLAKDFNDLKSIIENNSNKVVGIIADNIKLADYSVLFDKFNHRMAFIFVNDFDRRYPCYLIKNQKFTSIPLSNVIEQKILKLKTDNIENKQIQKIILSKPGITRFCILEWLKKL